MYTLLKWINPSTQHNLKKIHFSFYPFSNHKFICSASIYIYFSITYYYYCVCLCLCLCLVHAQINCQTGWKPVVIWEQQQWVIVARPPHALTRDSERARAREWVKERKRDREIQPHSGTRNTRHIHKYTLSARWGCGRPLLRFCTGTSANAAPTIFGDCQN
jgi:hypothetical protein